MSTVFSGGELRGLETQPGSFSAGTSLPSNFVPQLDRDGRIVGIDAIAASIGDPEWMYRNQPAIRSVVDWRVNRIVRVPLQALVKVSDAELQPATGRLPDTLANPEAPTRTGQAGFMADLAYDWHLHDRWLVLVTTRDAYPGFNLTRLPAWRWQPRLTSLGRVSEIRVDGNKSIDPASCLFDYGRGGGTSPMATLQEVLSEIVEGARYRRQTWARGVRAKAVVERPKDAGDWSDTALKRFQEGFGDAYQGDGPLAGGVPVLEDDMKLKTIDLMSATDTEYLEGLRLNAVFVAMMYDTAPELLGLRPGTYSNMDALRQAIYRETLGGFFTRVAAALDGITQGFIQAEPATYLAFDLEAALAGSFIEQHQIFQTATGAPYMLRSEPRMRLHLPPVDGFDEPVVPLNVLVGGLASPRDTNPATFPKSGDKSGTNGTNGTKESMTWRDVIRGRLEAELTAFYADQEKAVSAILGQGLKAQPAAPLDWDGERWDAELAAILLRHGLTAADLASKEVLDLFGGAKADEFDPDLMLPYLYAAANNTATRQNTATQQKISDAVTDPEWPDRVADVYSEAKGDRSITLAATLVTGLASFGAHEAAQHVGARTKTWNTLSPNARASHARMAGETVDIGSSFSNGLRYPGDSRGSADETAGCTCAISYGTGE